LYQVLKGLRILDLTRLLPGPYATQLLADMGAEVLKVEDTVQGDYMRWMKPHFPGTKDSALFWGLNRNKESIKLDLKSDAGKSKFLELVRQYDVVLEGFRPGVMDKLGLGYDKLKEVNSGIIMCAISGYGQDGPYRERAGHDINYNAIAGALGLSGHQDGPPVVPAVQVADIGGGGLMAAVGILAAYVEKLNTGEGRYIDISMMDGVVSWMAMLMMQHAAGDPTLARGASMLNGGMPCYNVYKTKDDKYMSLGALEEKFWRVFCGTVGREDLIPRQFDADPSARAEVAAIFVGRTRAEWSEVFAGQDVCCEPVLDINEVAAHPQVAHRGLLKNMPHPKAGQVKVTANPIKFPGAPETEDTLPPGWGENNTNS